MVLNETTWVCYACNVLLCTSCAQLGRIVDDDVKQPTEDEVTEESTDGANELTMNTEMLKPCEKLVPCQTGKRIKGRHKGKRKK